jgi:hypothetical protein
MLVRRRMRLTGELASRRVPDLGTRLARNRCQETARAFTQIRIMMNCDNGRPAHQTVAAFVGNSPLSSPCLPITATRTVEVAHFARC